MQELPAPHFRIDAVDNSGAFLSAEPRTRSYPSSSPNDRCCRTYPGPITVVAPYSGRTGAPKGRGVRGPCNCSRQGILRPCTVLLACWERPPEPRGRVVLPATSPAVDALPRLTSNTAPLHAHQDRLLYHHPSHFRSPSVRSPISNLAMAARRWPLAGRQRRRSLTRGPLPDRKLLVRPFTSLLHGREILQVHPLVRARRGRHL